MVAWTARETALIRAVLERRGEGSSKYGKWIQADYNALVEAEAERASGEAGAAPPRRMNNKQCQGKFRRLVVVAGAVVKRTARGRARVPRPSRPSAAEVEEEDDPELRELIRAFDAHSCAVAAASATAAAAAAPLYTPSQTEWDSAM